VWLENFHNEEFRTLYTASSVIRVMNWRRIRWTRHV